MSPSTEKDPSPRRARRAAGARACLLAALAAASAGAAARAAPGPVPAIGVENEYADVIAQIGGAQVRVESIESDPNTDPHSFEVSPRIAGSFAAARLIVENGLGYDSWADRILAATRADGRAVIDVQHLLGLPDSTPNPHLWYAPTTMPKVARAIADDLSGLVPSEAAAFRANLGRFDASLRPWLDAIAAFRARHAGTPVATTEPVADYMLQAAGCDIETPRSLETAIMNGTDPSPQDVSAENALLDRHRVKVFVYNRQVTDALTRAFLARARKDGIPVVGVYETMPTPGYDYQGWMAAEVAALTRAVADGTSTETLTAGHDAG